MKFLSHSYPPFELIDHLVDVADKAEAIAAESKFQNKDIAYYTGLFHDIGKLNPYYQELFNDRKSTAELDKQYERRHSAYSSWIAKKVLRMESTLNKNQREKIQMIIYCHHTNMTNKPWSSQDRSHKAPKTEKILRENWQQFKKMYQNEQPFNRHNLEFDWPNDASMKSTRPLEVEDQKNYLTEYIELGFLYSVLLQADRGFFQRQNQDVQDQSYEKLLLDLSIKKNSKLTQDRSKFQDLVLKSINEKPITEENPIIVINAPTGIGKTKAFLDIINKIDKNNRIFYFSPLLALTNDFEEKMKTICKDDLDRIMTYNHVHVKMLEDDDPNEVSNIKWNFNQESFNEKFVITTMNRLLMTIYSSSDRDKLKLASFRNAILIVDEVQRIPRFMLNNLMEIFKIMGKMMGTKVLLISATIPHELDKKYFPTVKMSESDVADYLSKIDRQIVWNDNKFDIESIPQHGKNLIMFNTRKLTAQTFKKIDRDNKYYLSSGITKKQQDVNICKIKNAEDVTVVSTQVVEAGIDISFTNIWRQLAPLDNIIQVLGRLNREGESAGTLHIFDSKDSTPYSSLEFDESRRYLKKIDTVKKLYEMLPSYYKDIYEKNKTQSSDSYDFEECIKKLDFRSVWKKVNKHLSDVTDYYSVYVPDSDITSEDWKMIRDELSPGEKNIVRKNVMRKHAKIQAVLPISVYDKRVRGYFVEELFDKEIYYPKRDNIADLYHDEIGLDKWKII